MKFCKYYDPEKIFNAAQCFYPHNEHIEFKVEDEEKLKNPAVGLGGVCYNTEAGNANNYQSRWVITKVENNKTYIRFFTDDLRYKTTYVMHSTNYLEPLEYGSNPYVRFYNEAQLGYAVISDTLVHHLSPKALEEAYERV